MKTELKKRETRNQRIARVYGIRPDCTPEEAARFRQTFTKIGEEEGVMLQDGFTASDQERVGADKFAGLLARRESCFHEAGHAVAFWQMGRKVERVTVFKKGGGTTQPRPPRGGELESVFRYSYAAGIAAELRAKNIPAPLHPDLIEYLKLLHKPGFGEADEPGEGPTESDTQALLRLYLYPLKKLVHASPRKQKKFWNLAVRDVIEADRRLAPDWELVVCLADLLDKIHTLDEAQLQELFDWYTYAKHREAGHA